MPFHVAIEMFSQGGARTPGEWMATVSPPKDSESKGGTSAALSLGDAQVRLLTL